MIDDDQTEIEYKPLDVGRIRSNIGAYTSEKLAEMIVCHRYFGCYQEVAVVCMEELSRRRQSGQTFAFEDYIEQEFKKLPELKMSGINIRDVMQQAMAQRNRK